MSSGKGNNSTSESTTSMRPASMNDRFRLGRDLHHQLRRIYPDAVAPGSPCGYFRQAAAMTASDVEDMVGLVLCQATSMARIFCSQVSRAMMNAMSRPRMPRAFRACSAMNRGRTHHGPYQEMALKDGASPRGWLAENETGLAVSGNAAPDQRVGCLSRARVVIPQKWKPPWGAGAFRSSTWG